MPAANDGEAQRVGCLCRLLTMERLRELSAYAGCQRWRGSESRVPMPAANDGEVQRIECLCRLLTTERFRGWGAPAAANDGEVQRVGCPCGRKRAARMSGHYDVLT